MQICFIVASAVEGPPEPRNVHFYSENLRNIVRWTPGEGSPSDTVYTVEYAIYGDEEENSTAQVRWSRVKHCTSIAQNECDVSQETFSLEDDYYARVRAVSANAQSVWTESKTRFSPEFDTILGAPLVELTVLQNYVNVIIKGPFRWRTKKVQKDTMEDLCNIFPHMIYSVSVFSSRSDHTKYMRLKNGNLTLGPVDFSTQICVVVQAQSETHPLAYKPSERVCVETPKDPFRDQLLAAMLGGVLPSALCLCVLTVLGGLIHCYITDHRQKLPKSVQVEEMSEKLHTLLPQMPPTVIVNMIKIGKESALLGPAALPQLMSCDDLTASDVQAQLMNTDPQPAACYAQQVAPPAASAPPLADLQDEDSLSVDSELQPWPQEPQHIEAGDYGIVVPASFEPPVRREAESSPYRTQGHTVQPVDACEDELDDEDQTQIFLDWSPETRELKIPLMGLLGREDEAQVQTEAVTLLPNVILRQSSEDSGESEDDFTKMERDWGLIIHSSPD
ncbi:interleukin-20 receptor subunit alpha-like protein [Labeo rohita]|uniref:Interleukin-20 receptor subunit alpha-like protein n=1 Tax=Labeo rohita TaxID=84645 RepID=A0A498LD60_LABRO|nr:interleukin-20 receptor subunit alpha-like protein [Labeo rohita]